MTWTTLHGSQYAVDRLPGGLLRLLVNDRQYTLTRDEGRYLGAELIRQANWVGWVVAS